MAVIFISGSENEVETIGKGEGNNLHAFHHASYGIDHIEKYSSEKLFDENDMTFVNATGK